MNKLIVFTFGFALFPKCLIFGTGTDAVGDSAKTYLMDDIVITASRTDKSLFSIGRSVNVIKEEELSKSSLSGIGEILSREGVGFVTGATLTPGMNQSLFVRGANSNHTTILFNDIRLTDPSSTNNAPNILDIPLVNVEQIEIVRGAHSTLYGSSAIGGVVNVISRTKKLPGLHANLETVAGTFGKNTSSFSSNISVNYTMPIGFYINTAFNGTFVNGLDATIDTVINSSAYKNRDKDKYNNRSFVGRIGFENEIADFYLSYFNVKQHIDLDDGAFKDDDNYRLNFKRYMLSYGAKIKLNKYISLKYIGGFSPMERHTIDDSSQIDYSGTTDKSYAESKFEGYANTDEVLIDLKNSDIHTTVGIGRQYESMNQHIYSISPYGPYSNDLDTIKPHSTLKHLFIHSDIQGSILTERFENFNLALGIRLNEHSIYGTNYSYEINPSYKLSGNLLLYLSYTTGFNAPSLYQLYCPDVYYTSGISLGNRNLKPETSHTWELGLKYRVFEKFNLTLSYFESIVDDAIEFVYLWDKNVEIDMLGTDWMRDDNRGSTYINVGNQKTKGFEAQLHINITNSLSVSALTSITKGKLIYSTEKIDTIHTEGNHVQLYNSGAFLNKNVEVMNLARRPSYMNIMISYRPLADFTTKFSIRYVGTSYDAFYNSNIVPWGASDVSKLNDYTLVDVDFMYKLNNNIGFSLKLENIFNTKYSEILGYTTKGRGIYLGTMLSF